MWCRIDDISPVDEASLEREAVARAAATRAQSASALPPTRDDLPESGTPLAIQPAVPAEEAAQTTEEYMNICRAFIEQLRSGSAPWLLQRLNNTYGTMPTGPSEFSYWMALVRHQDLRRLGADHDRSCQSTNTRKPGSSLFALLVSD